MTSFADVPRVPNLEALSLRFLPPRVTHLTNWVEAAPQLKELTLGASHAVRVDGELAFDHLGNLSIELPEVPPWVRIPPSLHGLSLHAGKATDDQVRRLLAACPSELQRVSLRDTPVSDATLAELARFTVLEYLDVVGSAVTESALRSFVGERPNLRHHPRAVR